MVRKVKFSHRLNVNGDSYEVEEVAELPDVVADRVVYAGYGVYSEDPINAQANPFPQYVLDVEMGRPLGVATLDATGRIPAAQLPSSAATVDQVSPAVQQAIASALINNSILSNLADETGYVYAIMDAAGRVGAGLTPDGTWVAKISLKAGSVTYQALDADLASRVVAAPVAQALTTLADETGYAFAITDPTGHLAFGVRQDGTLIGKFAVAAGGVSFTSLTADLQARVTGPGAGSMLTTLADEAEYRFAITDAQGRLAFGVRPNGTLFGTIDTALNATPPPVADPEPEADYIEVAADAGGLRQLWRNRTLTGERTALTTTGDNTDPHVTPDGKVLFLRTLAGVTTGRVVALAGGTVYPAIPDRAVFAFGDSLTAGVGGTAGQGGYPTMLRTMLTSAGVPVTNYGIGGQHTNEIAARQGGAPALTTAPVTIPATTTGVIVPISLDLLFQSAVTTRTGTGSFLGIHGTIANNAGTYTFTRDTAGTATPLPVGTPFVSDEGVTAEAGIQVWFPGRNDLSQVQNLSMIEPFLTRMHGYLKPYVHRALILGVTGAVSEVAGSVKYTVMNAYNASAAATYGASFIDINRYLIDRGLTDAGITPTAQDTTDLANDVIPSSLHSSDGLHFTDATYQLIAQQVYNRIVAQGWLA